jgi:hypothetical protein
MFLPGFFYSVFHGICCVCGYRYPLASAL